jgi:hypothetical protein
MERKLFVFFAAVLVATGTAIAQQSPSTGQTTGQASGTQSTSTSTTTTSSAPKPGTVNARRQNQQSRIANGVQSGQLTAGETKNVESREANLNREVKGDRSADNGKLTQQEREQVNHQQNNLSKSIYTDKHNANTAHYGNNEVGARRQNQQNRIANGIRSGQMTAGEAAKTENKEQGINQQDKADRSANGGKLTGTQKQQLNNKLNGTSQQIYDQKHNDKVAPK